MPQEPTILVKKADGTSVRVPLSSLSGIGIAAEDLSKKKQTASNGQSAIVSSVQETRNKKQETSNEKQAVITNVQRSANSGHSLTDSSKREISNKKQDASNKQSVIPNQQQVVGSGVGQMLEASGAQQSVPKQSKSEEVTRVSPPLPTPSTPHELATVTPVNHFFENVSRARTWTADDHVSPLEESLPESGVQEVQSVVSPSRYADVARVSEALSFTIPTALESRLHSLIASRVKDVRSDDQVRAYARNASEEGGLNLSDAQADELVQAIHSALAVKKETVIPAPRTTPFGGRVPQAPPAPAQPAMSVPVQPTSSSASVVPTRSLSDIHPPVTPQRESMGPVDELASMALVDFRRLNKDPHRAVEVLQDKMQTMREESYLEYVKMSQAWIRSPLYREYLSYLEASLDQSRSLQDVLSGSDMTPEDIAVFSEFSESVRVT